jgi:hypothetical protein
VENGTDASRLGPLKKLFSLLTSTVEAYSSAMTEVYKTIRTAIRSSDTVAQHHNSNEPV